MKKQLGLVAFVSVLAVTLMACQFTSLIPTQAAVTPVPTLAPLPSGTVDLVSEESRLTALYARVSPGVVAIRAYSANGSGSLGSGWVYSADGYIVTNDHVVAGADTVEVDFSSGYKTYGTVIGEDAHSDLAVIKVDVPAAELHPLTLGDSSTLQPGQMVVAIGNPFGLNGTMTTGIVSAVGRAITSDVQASSGGYYSSADIIQNGEVVGVNSSIRTSGYTDTGEPVNSGIGFAISINIVKRVVPSLIEKGRFDYPYLGLSTTDNLLLADIEALGLKSNTGIYVTGVVIGGPAEQAGVRAAAQTISSSGLKAGGDLIIAVDGTPVQWFDDLMRYLILNKEPGDTIVLTVLRGSEQVDLTLTLGKRP
jgi:S1-C subfamily serine protease